MNGEMKHRALEDDALETVSGGAGSGQRPEAKFSIGDWARYAYNTEIVALVTSRTYDETGGYWKYGVKFNGEGQELRWVGESLMTKTSGPN